MHHSPSPVPGIEARQGGGEWMLEIDGTVAAKGGILFHYNPPYGDIHMEVGAPHKSPRA